MGFTLISFVVGAGLLLLSRFFNKTGSNDGGLAPDDTPTTVSRRGAQINYVMGRRLVGCYFGHAWNRYTVQEGGDSGGGKGLGGGGGGGSSTTIYYENGWHIVTLGPASKLYSIQENGKTIWAGPISQATTPSGTVIDAGEAGTFRIYWGELDQPVCPELAAATGVNSRWPNVCYVVWLNRRNGTSPQWPDLKYDVECICSGVSVGSAAVLLDDGVNPHAIVHRLLAAPFPHGGGVKFNRIDETSLAALGVLCEAEGLGANVLIDEQIDLVKAIQGVLADVGAFLVEHEGRLSIMTLRYTDPVAVLTNDVLEQTETEVEVPMRNRFNNRVNFIYKNRDARYRDADIKYDQTPDNDDAVQSKASTIQLFMPTVPAVARRIANRRVQEAFGDNSTIKVRALRGTSLLLPGQAVQHPEFGVLRVLSSQYDPTNGSTELELAVDAYGVPAINDVGNDQAGELIERDVAEDVAFTFFELPFSVINTTTTKIAVLRLRAHNQIVGAAVHASVGDGSYTSIGSQNVSAAGGLLTGSLAASTGDIVEAGPIFEDANGDAARISDLSAATAEWQSGKQLAVINDEVCFLRNVTVQSETEWMNGEAVGLGVARIPTAAYGVTGLRYVVTTAGTCGTTQPVWPKIAGETVTDGSVVWTAKHFRYQLNGLIRSRYGTVKGTHAINDVVYVIASAQLVPLSNTLLQPGAQLCIKTQPRTTREIVDVSGVTAVCDQLLGIATNDTYIKQHSGSFLITHTGDQLITH